MALSGTSGQIISVYDKYDVKLIPSGKDFIKVTVVDSSGNPVNFSYKTVIANGVTQPKEPALDFEPDPSGVIGPTATDVAGTSTQLYFSILQFYSAGQGLVRNNVGSAGLSTIPSAGDHSHALRLNTVNQSVNYQMSANDTVVRATGGAGGITITLVAASILTIGQIAIIMKVDSGAGAVTVAPNGANTILGGNPSLASQGSSVTLRGATSTSWERIATI